MNQNKLNQKLKKLIRQLGEAIHETVSESEDIAGVVKDIREQGFDVMLMLEATIGLNELEDAEKAEVAAELLAQDQAPFNAHDLNFLKSLRITLEDTAEVGNVAQETVSQEAGPEETRVTSQSDAPPNPPAGTV